MSEDKKLEEIRKLEAVYQRYKNNYDFAVKNNNPIRQSKYKTLMGDIKKQIKDVEIEFPLESNVRLREIIDNLNDSIKKLQDDNKELKIELDKQNQKINDFINPPEPEPEPEPEANHECPACGRGGFRGVRGVKAHQSSGACGKARKSAVKS